MGRKMIGSGKYSKRTYEKAVKTGCAVMTSRGTAGKARKCHRDNLLDWVNDESAVDEEKGTITDPRNLVPFRGRNYAGIVKALLSRLKPAQVKDMTGQLTKDCSRIQKWSGQRDNSFDGVAASPWISNERLFEIACKQDSELFDRLKGRQSTRPGVKKENQILSPLQKFTNNVGTIQRTGGVTPDAMPLMISRFCIDSRIVAVKGKPQTQFRIVIDRDVPQKSGLRAYKAAHASLTASAA